MLPLGLSAPNLRTFHDGLADNHSIHVTLQLLNLEGDRLADISGRLLDGQVNMDVSAEVTRNCTLALLDPGRTLHFDSDSPANGALYHDRMIRVVYSVKSPDWNLGWVDVPVFTGPVTKMDRNDDVVNVECQGKEVLASGAAWTPKTYKKGTRRVYVCKNILQELAGENRFDFPDLNARLPKDLSVSRQTIPWNLAKRVANSMDRQLFYDGRGVVRMRRAPTTPVLQFSSGNGGTIVSAPQVSYNVESLKNIVWVKGGTPKGQRQAISVWKSAARSHPLSPYRLGRNGVPRYLLDVVDNQAIRSKTEARELAKTRLDKLLLEQIECAFDSLPIPHLEPNDLLRINTDEFGMVFRLKQFSLPLTVGQNMSIGYNKRVSVNRRAIRRR